MKSRAHLFPFVILCLLGCQTPAQAQSPSSDIPKAAWRRPLGQPVPHPGTKKLTLDAGHIDDGFWQGAPVGGFGVSTCKMLFQM